MKGVEDKSEGEGQDSYRGPNEFALKDGGWPISEQFPNSDIEDNFGM